MKDVLLTFSHKMDVNFKVKWEYYYFFSTSLNTIDKWAERMAVVKHLKSEKFLVRYLQL